LDDPESIFFAALATGNNEIISLFLNHPKIDVNCKRIVGHPLCSLFIACFDDQKYKCLSFFTIGRRDPSILLPGPRKYGGFSPIARSS
jgi:hypothetical protein